MKRTTTGRLTDVRAERGSIEPELDAEERRARRVLERLEKEAGRLSPSWADQGPEHPARVVLELLAQGLARVEQGVDDSLETLLPRLLESRGLEPRWATPRRSAVRLLPAVGYEDAVTVEAGTGVTHARSTAEGADADRWHFETAVESWLSAGRMVCALVIEGPEVRQLPVRTIPRGGSGRAAADSVADSPSDGGSSESSAAGAQDAAERAPLRVFRNRDLSGRLLLGDIAWRLLRDRAGPVILEWPGLPTALVDGVWEYSAGGSWRHLPVEYSVTEDAYGKQRLRLRIEGPLPDIAPREIESQDLPWLRWTARDEAVCRLGEPSIVWLPAETPRDAGVSRKPSDDAVDPLTSLASLPRRVFRTIGRRAHLAVDQSLAQGGEIGAPDLEDDACPSLWFGFDRALSASFYVECEGDLSAARIGGDPDGERAAGWAWEYSSPDGFAPLEVIDETAAFCRSGTVTWRAPRDWKKTACFDRPHFWVRARWVRGAYERAPRLRALWSNTVEVVEGRALRDQVIRIERADASAEITSIDGEIEPFDRLDVAGPSGEWMRLHRRLEIDRGLGFDLRRGEFRLRRAGPRRLAFELPDALWPAGARSSLELRIPLVRVGLRDTDADLPAVGTLDVLESDVVGLGRCEQPVGVTRGGSHETPTVFRERVRSELAVSGRAVTAVDFRRLVRSRDPRIARVEVLASKSDPSSIFVVCFPVDEGGHPVSLSPWRAVEIERWLEPRCVLGSRVRVVEPRCMPFSVDIEIEADWSAPSSAAVRRLEAALRENLDPLLGGEDGRGYPLGNRLRADRLLDIIARLRSRETGGAFDFLELHPEAVSIDSELSEDARLDPAIGLPLLQRVRVVGSGGEEVES